MKRKVLSSLGMALFPVVFLSLSLPAFADAKDKAARIDEFVKLYYDQGDFNGTVLAADKGNILFKKGYGLANREWNIPHTPETKFRIGSITKQCTSMLIMQFVEQKKVDLQGKLSTYLPYYRKDIGDKVTIHHLLTHTSGIPSYTDDPQRLEEAFRDPYPTEEFIKKYCSDDLEFEPGSRFRYNNSGYFILGGIIEAIAGRPYEEVLKERILDPVGMKNTGYDYPLPVIKNRASGYDLNFDGYVNAQYLNMSLPFAAGALYSTVEDLYLWDQALYTEKLLSKEMKQIMFKPYVLMDGNAKSYACGWAVKNMTISDSHEKRTTLAHGGVINGFNTLIERVVDDKDLVVILNNTPGADLAAMSEGIIQILHGRQPAAPKKSIARAIYPTLLEKGAAEAVKLYKELKEQKKEDYRLNPMELNRLGYHLLNSKKMVKEAIEILTFNTEEYPEDANAYDSLAEAHMVNGDKIQAIINYAKSLQLDPDNVHAVEKLKTLINK